MGTRGSRLGAAVAMLILCASATARADTVRPSPGGVIRDIACTSTSDCLAVANNGPQGSLVPITNGVPGSAVSLPTNFDPANIACLSASSCVVVGMQFSGGGETATTQGGIVPVDNGVPGAVQIVQGASELRAVACPTASGCVSAGRGPYGFGISGPGDAVVVAIDGGRAGSVQAVNGPTILDGVACESASSCVAVGSRGANGTETGFMVPIMNGVSGSPQPVAGTADLFGVACPPGTGRCLAAGQEVTGASSQGVLVPISGGTPGAGERVAASNSLWHVSCPSASVCDVSGVGGVETGVPIAGGGIGSWHSVQAPGAYLDGLYCATETSCVAGGYDKTGRGIVVDVGGNPPATPAAAVNQSLAVSGPSASIPAILSSGGYSANVGAPSAGTMKIVWYYVPPGAHVARVSKPVVVAQGSKSFAAAGSATLKLRLTSAGRTLLKHSKRMKLTAVASFAPKHGKSATKRKSITLGSH